VSTIDRDSIANGEREFKETMGEEMLLVILYFPLIRLKIFEI